MTITGIDGASRRPATAAATDLVVQTRTSDSPWIESVWTSASGQVTQMTSAAGVTWGLMFWTQDGVSHVSLSPPGTRTGTARVPPGAEFIGIEFALGTSLRRLPLSSIVDTGIRELPATTAASFRLDGLSWETPGADDAEALAARLGRAGALVHDPLVRELRGGYSPPVTARTLERRFRAATGLTQGAVRQIERARTASALLTSGRPMAEVVAMLGYYDEPHLARALRRFIGRTAGQLRGGSGGPIGLAIPARVSVARRP